MFCLVSPLSCKHRWNTAYAAFMFLSKATFGQCILKCWSPSSITSLLRAAAEWSWQEAFTWSPPAEQFKTWAAAWRAVPLAFSNLKVLECFDVTWVQVCRPVIHMLVLCRRKLALKKNLSQIYSYLFFSYILLYSSIFFWCVPFAVIVSDLLPKFLLLTLQEC